ncbi:MAG TPA: NUDIX domain-containing protein [Roseiflexaceae bacterium]|nr:NUDIX domain-containing protein [Roseiflexaceae bacterium]
MTQLHPLTDRRTLAIDLLRRLADAAPTEDGRPARPVALTTDHPFTHGYERAITDLLTWLGTLSPDRDGSVMPASSYLAGYLPTMLAALLELDRPLVDDWSVALSRRLHTTPFRSGAELLLALELRRQELDPEPRPLRETTAALALIARREHTGEMAYLLSFDRNADAWQLPGGRRELCDGDLRQTLLRELTEELECGPLHEPEDLHVVDLGTPFIEQRISPTCALLTCSTLHLYAVRLHPDLPLLSDRLAWFRESDVLNKRTPNGETIAAQPLLKLYGRGDLNLPDILAL